MANALKNYDNILKDSQMNAEEWAQPLPEKKLKSNELLKAKEEWRRKLKCSLFVQVGVCLGVTVGVCLFWVHSHSSLSEKEIQLNNLKAEKVALTNQITTLEAQITKKKDLKEIKEKATDELNMQSPLAHQIVYIDITSEDETQ